MSPKIVTCNYFRGRGHCSSSMVHLKCSKQYFHHTYYSAETLLSEFVKGESAEISLHITTFFLTYFLIINKITRRCNELRLMVVHMPDRIVLYSILNYIIYNLLGLNKWFTFLLIELITQIVYWYVHIHIRFLIP